MTTNDTKKVITITESELAELQKAREQAERRKEYRVARNQKPDVKMKNAEYHEKRNARLKAHDAAFKYLVENNLLSDEVMERLLKEVAEYEEYTNIYTATE